MTRTYFLSPMFICTFFSCSFAGDVCVAVLLPPSRFRCNAMVIFVHTHFFLYVCGVACFRFALLLGIHAQRRLFFVVVVVYAWAGKSTDMHTHTSQLDQSRSTKTLPLLSQDIAIVPPAANRSAAPAAAAAAAALLLYPVLFLLPKISCTSSRQTPEGML